jgi:O-antigen/teichoic acid export membrane protein
VNCYFFRNEIMQLLYPASTAYWATIFGWLMLNFIPMSSVYIFGTLLTAKGSLKALNLLALGGMVLNVGLNFLLIPGYGALGATIATLITQTLIALLHFTVAQKQFALHFDLRDMVKLSFFIFVCIAIPFIARTFELGWMLNFSVCLIACFLIAIALKLVPLGHVLALLKSKVAS